jgi:hypothetical protein
MGHIQNLNRVNQNHSYNKLVYFKLKMLSIVMKFDKPPSFVSEHNNRMVSQDNLSYTRLINLIYQLPRRSTSSLLYSPPWQYSILGEQYITLRILQHNSDSILYLIKIL